MYKLLLSILKNLYLAKKINNNNSRIYTWPLEFHIVHLSWGPRCRLQLCHVMEFNNCSPATSAEYIRIYTFRKKKWTTASKVFAEQNLRTHFSRGVSWTPSSNFYGTFIREYISAFSRYFCTRTLPWMFDYNLGDNILELYNVLVQVQFPTSKVKLGI